MSLVDIKALAHPDGNKIELSWSMPPDVNYRGTRVVRGIGSFPVNPDDGLTIAEADALVSAIDAGLKAEEVYYYSLFPYTGTPPLFEIDRKNRISEMATSPQDYAAFMYSLLPAIYHRYDKDSQTLKRFLELTGGQLDQLHSFAKASENLKNLDKVNGELLPLLAGWIGWQTDNQLEFRRQREEIRHAPAIYKTIGLIPTVEATTKRISGWESRSKEFVHNIFTSNRPEHLNLWSLLRDSSDIWSETPELLSMDYAFEGRSASTLDNHGIRWLFYHTQRKGYWQIWYKTSVSQSVPLSLLNELQDGVISIDLLAGLNEAGLLLSPAALIATVSAGRIWEISDAADTYVIENHIDQLLVYSLNTQLTALSASLPLVVNNSLILKYPCVAQQAQNLWLFWSAYDETSDQWQIQYRVRSNAQWSDIGPAEPDPLLDIAMNPFAVGGIYDPAPQRRNAFSIVDNNERLWLFWQENNGSGWQLRYNRRAGVVWGTAVTFPAAGAPRVDADISVVFQPGPRIYVFWARQAETLTPGQIRWQVAYRVKQDLDLNDANWSTIRSLPKDAVNDDHHDREPSPVLQDGNVELFWSSNREDTGWSLWRSILTDPVTNTWSPAQRLTAGAYSQRTPLPVIVGDETWLIYRSNQGIAYKSEVYGATQTFDERYAGSSSMDVRQGQKLALRKKFEDIQHYTYDTGKNGQRSNDNWVARDTIGVYLDNSTLDEAEIDAGIARLRPVLKEFMPITDRAVFISRSELHTEYVYSYGLPVTSESNYISSTYADEFTSVLAGNVLGDGEDFSDHLDI